jgi:hypothetical protein
LRPEKKGFTLNFENSAGMETMLREKKHGNRAGDGERNDCPLPARRQAPTGGVSVRPFLSAHT